MTDLLGDFTLEVIGVCESQGCCAAGIEYLFSETSALEGQIYHLRDEFVFNGEALSVLKVEHPEVFTKPVPPLPRGASASVPHADVPTPATPVHVEGITAKHSGWSPELEMRRAQINELLVRPRGVPQPLAVPEPVQDASGGLNLVLSKLTELTVGVNELRASQASVVTRADLKEFHEKANAETRAFVLSQTDPLNESVTHLLKSEVANFDRVGRLESRVDKLVKPKGPDLSFQQLAVVQFPENAALEDRLEAMQTFMRTQFPKVHVKGVSVIHRGDWKERGKNRSMTRVGLIDVGNADVREYIMKIIEAKNLKVPCAGKSLKIARAMTDNAKDRNTALTGAADLLKKQPGLSAKDVSIEWTGSRSVKAKGAIAFEQPAGRDLGSFCGAYAHLKLP